MMISTEHGETCGPSIGDAADFQSVEGSANLSARSTDSLMVDHPLITAAFKDYKPTMGTAIRTTVGANRWFRHPHVHARLCTPYGVFGKYEDEAEYRAAYLAKLDEAGDAVIQEIRTLTVPSGGRGALLCFCKVAQGEWCHRRMLATWLQDRYGLFVPEFGTEPGVDIPLFDVETGEPTS